MVGNTSRKRTKVTKTTATGKNRRGITSAKTIHLELENKSMMGENKLQPFFLAQKISKIRWVPEQLKDSESFITGTWEMLANFVSIWRLEQNQYPNEFNEYKPRCSDKVFFRGDVSGLEFLADDLIAVGCTDGYVSLLKIKRGADDDKLDEQARSSLLHTFSHRGKAAPCTGISVHHKDIATVGEDGRLNIIDAGMPNITRRTIEADSLALTAVAYVNPKEVLTANSMGVVRMFDVRSATDSVKPSISFVAPRKDDKNSNYVSCVVSHPTQPHIVLTGSEEGSIAAWDLRKPGLTASYIGAHTSAITDINFKQGDPTKALSAAEDGELWLWAEKRAGGIGMDGMEAEQINPWLTGDRAKTLLDVTSLLELPQSINSFDARGTKVICGGDSEVVYFIDNSVL